MLREMQTPSDPVLKRIVEQLVREEIQQIARERRSAHREPLIRPVTISLRSDGAERSPSPKQSEWNRQLPSGGIRLSFALVST